MATVITIEIVSNPAPFEVLEFSVENTDMSYTRTIAKTFVPGTPVAINQVEIGIDAEVTMLNLIANLSVNDTSGFENYELAYFGAIIIMSFDIVATYNLNVVSDAAGSFSILPELLVDEFVSEVPTLAFNGFAIEIIDTYNNDTSLVDEFTQMGSPILSYDGGDDMYEPIFSSKLKFNMWVADGMDGKYKHLFSSDENRFLVKLSNINEDEESELIWQGYLQPDEYKEPYKTGGFFVDFEAVDMIGSLKNVYLDKWLYRNRFPIMKVIALLLAPTKLNQSFVVAPSFVPANAIHTFKDINVPLNHYAKNDDYDDCYTILKDILEANGLTIYSYRGKFFITGFTRKKDLEVTSYVFDVNGNLTGEELQVKTQQNIYFEDGSATVTAIPPYKEVEVTLKAETEGNILPTDIVQVTPEYVTSINKPDQVEALGHIFRYQTQLFDGWNRVGPYAPVFRTGNGLIISYYNPFTSYNMNEAFSMFNYYEFQEKFYIKKNTDYQLDIDGEIFMVTNSDAVDMDLSDFLYKLNFQILIDDIEIASSRYNYHNYSNFLYEVSDGRTKDENGFFSVKYKLSTTFSSSVSGNIKIRVLAPLFSDLLDDNGSLYVKMSSVSFGKFLIAPAEKETLEQTVKAIRNIEYTKGKKIEIPFISSKNLYFRNNLGIGYSINSDYENVVSYASKVVRSLWQYTYNVSAIGTIRGKINVHEYVINKIYELFGRRNLKKNLFKQTAAGEKIYFDKVACKLDNKMIYIESIEDNPVLPKDYKPLPKLVSGDVLKYFEVRYGAENIALRDEWLIYGMDVSTKDTFIKNFAKSIHFTKSVASYSIEGTQKNLLFPDNLCSFYYDNQDRIFIPTRLDIDLSQGITSFKAIEDVYNVLDDISYE